MSPEKTARQAGLNFFGTRSRSVKELRDKLLAANFPMEEVDRAIADFRRLKLLDDRSYARRWVESRLERNRPAGVRKFARDLLRKGIARSTRR